MEIVFYDSLKPLLPILEFYESPVIQLWAVWTLNHLFTKNREKFLNIFFVSKILVSKF
jgi:hypothetical protein